MEELIMERKIFTSESVTEGHPDKICDQISDAVLDAILTQDPDGRVACEVMATTGLVIVAGEITTSCYADIEAIARNTVKGIGYDKAEYGFDGGSCGVIVTLDSQSPDIAMGVNQALESKDQIDVDDKGAGDQGIIFGYAINETPEYMPLPIVLSHKITKKLAEVRKNGTLSYLRPDGKSQVSVEYIDDVPKRVTAVVVSSQHCEHVTHAQIEKDIIEHVIKTAIPAELLDSETKYLINPTGRFVIGGPMGDCGLTGRKIIVDSYGGFGRHGGGAFSGKDPTKVDRSGAYMARYIAKNVVAAGIARECEIEIAYAIGVAQPVSVYVTTRNSGIVPDSKIEELIRKHFDMRPSAIIKKLDLKRPIYKQTAAYGHFGRNDLDLPWEKLDMVEVLKAEV